MAGRSWAGGGGAGVGARGAARAASTVREVWLDRLTDGLLTEGADHAQRVRLEREQREDLAALGRPITELPAMPGGIDLGALYDLSAVLLEQGVVVGPRRRLPARRRGRCRRSTSTACSTTRRPG